MRCKLKHAFGPKELQSVPWNGQISVFVNVFRSHSILLEKARASLFTNGNRVQLGRTGTDNFVLSVLSLAVGGCVCSHVIYMLVCVRIVSSRWKKYCKPGMCVLCLHTNE